MGSVRNLDLTSALAAALKVATSRVRGLAYRMWAATQVRLNLTGTASRSQLLGTPVIPTVRYRDVPAAVDWLCRAFGMQVHRVVTDAKGAPRYAELTVGSGMLMVAPIEDTAFGKLMVQPDEIGGVETQVCYLCVGNARAHHARAKAAGAVIIIDPEDEANRGRGYSCRDPEGHVWNFGTYDPWGKQPAAQASPGWGLGRAQQAMAALVLLAVAATLVMELLPQPSARAGTAIAVPEPTVEPASVEVATVPALAPAVEPPRPAADAKADTPAAPEPASDAPLSGVGEERRETPSLHVPRVALAAAEHAATEARTELAETRSALAKAQREATAVRSQLEEMQRAKLAAERRAGEAHARLAAAMETAERARDEATAERSKRRATVRAVVRVRHKASRRHIRRRAAARTWCYSASAAPPSVRGARLAGFCRG